MSYLIKEDISKICGGCLSKDRKLSVLNEECQMIFCSFLRPINVQSLFLCWECLKMLKNIRRFQKQLITAHDTLVQFMINKNIGFQSLSKLANSEIKYITQEICYNALHPKDESFMDFLLEEKKINSNKDHLMEPLAFVKLKDEMLSEEIEGYFVDEYSDNSQKEDNIKAVFNLNEAQSPSKKKKTRNNSKKIEEFNDSDDEPLTELKSKEEKEKKPIGRRKREKVLIKESQEPKRRVKREAPPGRVQSASVLRKLLQLNVSTDQIEMTLLSWEQVEEERRKALQSETFTRHDYRCYDCVIGFNHKFKLENHMLKHDPASGPVVCSVCKVRCRSTHALAAHRRRHRLRWRCTICGFSSTRAAITGDHQTREHLAAPPTHTCALCGETHTTLGKLRIHLKEHRERQKCEICGKTFKDRTSLKTHLFIHTGEKEYACTRCDKKFLFKKALQVHMVTHDAPAHLYCLQCDMNFKNQMSYYQHMKYNLKHIDPAKLKYACKLCDKKFLKASRLEEHNLAVHLKLTPIRCTMGGCNFACSSRAVLRTHIRMLHRDMRSKRDHVCHSCGKAYTTKKTLEGHMRSHTGERPFKCSLCPSNFGYEAALYNHNKLVHLKGKVLNKKSTREQAGSNIQIDFSSQTSCQNILQNENTTYVVP